VLGVAQAAPGSRDDALLQELGEIAAAGGDIRARVFA